MSDSALLGAVIGGKYRVESVLGEGAFGTVFAARHVELEEDVAIKVLRKEKAGSADVVERFVREARAAVRLKGEHVVRVHDVGKLETGVPYIVMERLVGCDLEQLLARRGRLPVDEIAGYLLQACDGIAEAHALGMVHRDLKLSNLFLTTRQDGSLLVKVLDFGIAKWAPDGPDGEAAKRLTGGGAGMGSPLYMSPEQLHDPRDADVRSDVWSLGVILHELTSGKPPFDAPTAHGVLAAVLTASAPPLRPLAPSTPVAFEEIVLGCLVKDRDARIATVAELASALAAFAPEEDRACLARILRLAAGGRPSRVSFASIPDSVDRREGYSPTLLAGHGRATQHDAAIPRRTSEDGLAPAGLSSPASSRTYVAISVAALGIALGLFVATRSPRRSVSPVGLVSGAELSASAGPSSLASTLSLSGTTASADPSATPGSPPDAGTRAAKAGATHHPVAPGIASSRSTEKKNDLRRLIDGRR